MGFLLKPFMLLFDEYYTNLYLTTEAEARMNRAGQIMCMGASFSENITAIALLVAARHPVGDCRPKAD